MTSRRSAAASVVRLVTVKRFQHRPGLWITDTSALLWSRDGSDQCRGIVACPAAIR